MSITVITGPPASGKTRLSKQMKEGKSAFELWGLPGTFTKIPKNTDLLIIEGISTKDMNRVKSFCRKKKIDINIPMQDGYSIEMPNLIFVLDNWNIEQLKLWDGLANRIITCSNPK